VSHYARSLWVLGALVPALALAQAKPPKSKAAKPAASTPAKPAPAKPATPAPEEPAAAAPAPAAAAPAEGAPGPALGAEEANELKVRSLEERVSDLKEKIFRTKARLMNLQEMVIGGDVTTGSKVVIVHRNEMGSSFYLESVAYSLDGAPVYTKVDVDGDLEKREEFEIFNGRIVAGNHQITVALTYRGHGYGVFSYLEGYRFKVQSSYTFLADPGKVNTIKVVGFEKGGLTAELKDRPAIRYDVDVKKEETRGTVPAAAEGPRK
jgi:uncharacterized small protein (DUF1192 family)